MFCTTGQSTLQVLEEVTMSNGDNLKEKITDGFTYKRAAWTIALIFLMIVVSITLWSKPIDLEKFGKWLGEAGTANVACGLITLLVVLATVVIAICLVVFSLWGKVTYKIAADGLKTIDEEFRNKRFNHGLQVLTLFMGIPGTIMGFYCAEGTVPVKDVKVLKDSEAEKVITVAELENTGWRALKDLSFEGALKAFVEAKKDKEHSPIVDRILELLEPEEENFAEAKTEEQKTNLWKPIFCKIKDDKDISAIPADLKAGFDETFANKKFDCAQPAPEGTEE